MTTRKECARLLKCLNVAIVPSETGGFNCHVEDMLGSYKSRMFYSPSEYPLDKNGVRVTKSVHFRLEIEVITSSRPATPSLVRSMSFTANDRSSTSSSRSDWNTSLHIAASPPIKSSKLQPLIQDPVVSNDAQGMQVICNVLLILEKGANSTLRIVHERMQESWRLVLCSYFWFFDSILLGSTRPVHRTRVWINLSKTFRQRNSPSCL